MVTRIAKASDALAPAFLAYCARHGAEHDESYIPGSSWAFGEDFPSFILTDGNGATRGAAAFMLSPSFRAARRARVAILHALGDQSAAAYRPLLDAAVKALGNQADDCYLFIPEDLAAQREAFEGLGFLFERTAYLMTAPTLGALPLAKAQADLPAGYGLYALAKPSQASLPGGEAGKAAGAPERVFPDGLEDFVAVRNRNFRELQGSMDTRPEDLLEFMDAAEYLPGGLMLALSPAGEPCGTLRVERDDEEGSGFIGTLSVDKEHRGKGLARALVRIALSFSGQAGFREAGLSVNAENRNALRLYESEGFSVIKAMSCLSLRLDGAASSVGAPGKAARPR